MSASIPTPKISHFTADDYEHIYEPAEDSFILLDALEQHASELRDLKPSLCVEIGTGSGVVSTFLAQLLGPTTSVFIGTDINPLACTATQRTAEANSVTIDSVRSHLISPLKKMWGKVDVVVFNPPYVPTDEDELSRSQTENDIGGAWAGGADGMELTNVILTSIRDILAPRGRCYLVAVEQNKPREIMAAMMKSGISCNVVLRRRAGRERLSVLRMQRLA